MRGCYLPDRMWGSEPPPPPTRTLANVKSCSLPRKPSPHTHRPAAPATAPVAGRRGVPHRVGAGRAGGVAGGGGRPAARRGVPAVAGGVPLAAGRHPRGGRGGGRRAADTVRACRVSASGFWLKVVGFRCLKRGPYFSASTLFLPAG